MVVDSLKSVASMYSSSKIKGIQNKQNSFVNQAYAEKQDSKAQSINKLKSLLRGETKNDNRPASVVDSTLNYGKTLREQRTGTKSTSNALKQLKYNCKNISGQIRGAKKSTNAKQVASKARREVIQLKMKLASGKYDKEELQAAIEHAKSMERVANKKARHLEEEELIKITDKPAGAGLTTSELEEKLENQAEEAINKYEEELEQLSEDQVEKMEEEISESIEEVSEMMQESMEVSMENMSEDIYDLLAEAMKDMMEDTLEGLMDGMMVITDYEMTDDEFKAFKTKHRTSEDKSMIEADAKYLKALFDIYDKRMSGGSSSGIDFQGSVSGSVSGDMGTYIPNIVDVSV